MQTCCPTTEEKKKKKEKGIQNSSVPLQTQHEPKIVNTKRIWISFLSSLFIDSKGVQTTPQDRFDFDKP